MAETDAEMLRRLRNTPVLTDEEARTFGLRPFTQARLKAIERMSGEVDRKIARDLKAGKIKIVKDEFGIPHIVPVKKPVKVKRGKDGRKSHRRKKPKKRKIEFDKRITRAEFFNLKRINESRKSFGLKPLKRLPKSKGKFGFIGKPAFSEGGRFGLRESSNPIKGKDF